MAGDNGGALVEFRAAAARTANLREQHYLATQAARLATDLAGTDLAGTDRAGTKPVGGELAGEHDPQWGMRPD